MVLFLKLKLLCISTTLHNSKKMELNRIEQKLIQRFVWGDDWMKSEDGGREIRIGTVVNCNGELLRIESIHQETSAEMIRFMESNGIDAYGIHSIDTPYEYSNCLRLGEDEYNKLKQKFSTNTD